MVAKDWHQLSVKMAETKYGLRYTTFIGDGDSSVYPTLVPEVPGWGHVIRKVECANHCVKCYRSSLEASPR